MKQVGTDTVGGRIRKVRKDQKQTMQAFAAALGVSTNYVGALERGERSPSAELLQKIASIAEVSINWLAYGDGNELQELKISVQHDAADPAQMVNPQLYLSIVTGMVPAITKEALGPMLAVPPQAIDDIFSGEAIKYNPRWRTGYTVLAQNLDLPALRRDLRSLDAYLAWEEATLRNTALLRALRQHMAEKFEVVEVSSVNGQEPDAVPIHVPYIDIVLVGRGEQDYTWHFKYVPEQDDPEDFFPEDVLRHAEALAERSGCKVSIVLTSEAEYDKMCRHCDQMDSNAEALAARDLPINLPQGVSFIHLDQRTEEVEEWEFSEDDYWTDES